MVLAIRRLGDHLAWADNLLLNALEGVSPPAAGAAAAKPRSGAGNGPAGTAEFRGGAARSLGRVPRQDRRGGPAPQHDVPQRFDTGGGPAGYSARAAIRGAPVSCRGSAISATTTS